MGSKLTQSVGDQSATASAAGVRQLVLTIIAVVGSLATWFSAVAILPELAQEWALPVASLPWLTNAVQIGFVVGAIGSSVLNLPDSVPLHRLMGASAAVAAIANLLLLLDPGIASIGLRFVTGLALAGVYPPAMKLMATWFKSGRGMVLGLIIAALTLGSSLPYLFRGLVGQMDWQWVVIGTSATSLIAAVIFLSSARPGPYATARVPIDFKAFGRVFRDRPLFLANLGYFGHMWELYAMWGWFFAFAVAASQSGIPELQGRVAIFTFCVIAAGVPGCIIGGWLSDRIGRTRTCSIMLAGSGFCALLIGVFFEGPTVVFVILSLVWGLTVIGDSAQFSAAATELADKRYVGTALALQLGMGFALTVVAIWLTPIVADWVGWRWTFLMLVPGPIIGLIAMLKLRTLPESAKLAGGRR
ncbi:MAG: MFS transporter [Pseudomonadota bacterium]